MRMPPVQTRTIRGSFPDLHDIPAALHALHNAAVPVGGIISIYLDTGGSRSRRRAYLAAFRNARKRAAGQLVASELPGFDSAAARADWFLEHLFVPRHPGLALFAAGDVEYLYTVPLPQPPEEFVGWDTRPLLAPLEATLDDHERVALAIFDRRRIRLFTLFLGALEEHRVLPCQPMCGNADTAADGVLKVDCVQRYTVGAGSQGFGRFSVVGGVAPSGQVEDRLLVHAQHATRALTDLLRSQSFDRLFVAGPQESTAVLRAKLPRPLQARLAGQLSLAADASNLAVQQAMRHAAEGVERRGEVELVDRLRDASNTPNAVLGFDATLGALSDDRVYHLVLADTLSGWATQCTTCQRLVSGPGPCTGCGSRTASVLDAREAVVRRARGGGASVETISGETATLLLTHGGLGAWTRC